MRCGGEQIEVLDGGGEGGEPVVPAGAVGFGCLVLRVLPAGGRGEYVPVAERVGRSGLGSKKERGGAAAGEQAGQAESGGWGSRHRIRTV